MTYQVEVQTFSPRILAAFRRRVAPRSVGASFREPLDKVWALLRAQPGLRTDGHNTFLYHHDAPQMMTVDFGVEVTRAFPADGEVDCVTTPGGEAAVVIHRGPYSKLAAAHEAVHQWFRANGRNVGSYSMEIYGDPTPDPEKTETTIAYFLA
jgi:Transcriptional regulator, effector-binding domain/component